MSKLALLALGVAAGAYCLSRYGRQQMAMQLSAADIGPEVASSISFTDAVKAGARALVGKDPYPPIRVEVQRQ